MSKKIDFRAIVNHDSEWFSLGEKYQDIVIGFAERAKMSLIDKIQNMTIELGELENKKNKDIECVKKARELNNVYKEIISGIVYQENHERLIPDDELNQWTREEIASLCMDILTARQNHKVKQIKK